MTTEEAQTIAQQVIAQIRAAETGLLVADARERLGVPTESATDPKVLEATGDKAIVMNTLIARAAELKAIAKASTDEYEEIKAVIRGFLGDAEVLKVNNAIVATNKTTISRLLDQSYVKNRFPDVEGNEEFYADSPRTTFLLK